ncbi:hypothetical protein D3C76_1209860 [compost metagenome]
MAVDDLPVTTQVGLVKRFLEAAAQWCIGCRRCLGAHEGLLGAVLGDGQQLVAIERKLLGLAALETGLPLLFIGAQLAVSGLETIAIASLLIGHVELPLEHWAVLIQRLAQAAGFDRRSDGFLVDPDTVEIFGFVAGAAAQ